MSRGGRSSLRVAARSGAALALALTLAGCGNIAGRETEPRVVPVPPPTGQASDADVEAGRRLFGPNCAGCHGMDGTGTALGPDLTTSTVALRPDGVRRQVEEGQGAMPAFASLLDADETDAIVAYVVRLRSEHGQQAGGGGGGQTSSGGYSGGAAVKVAGSAGEADLGHGAAVYAANCSACHGIDGSGDVGPDIRGSSSYEDVYRQVSGGGGGMPPFGDLMSGTAIEDVSGYVVERLGRGSSG